MTDETKGAPASYGVGDEIPLEGHAIVAYPDGTVVTTSRVLIPHVEGVYRVIYNDPKKADVEISVGASKKPRRTRRRSS